jgi:hypothetical protein
MAEETAPLPGRWKERWRDLAVSIWVAFLSASAGTFVVFGVLDPAELSRAWSMDWELSRKLAYSLGFAFLFLLSFATSYLTVFMIRTGPRSGHSRGQGRRPPPATRSPTENNPDLDTEDWL